MELTPATLSAISKPTILCRDPKNTELLLASTSDPSWDSSLLNPQKRINSLDDSQSGWRIDGANMLGQQLYAVPTSLLPDLPPSGIYVYLPDAVPIQIREALEYSKSLVLRHGPHIARLGLSRHICRALDHHCRQNPEFLGEYSRLPYGSQLAFDKICADITQMKLQIVPGYQLEKQTKSVSSLQKLWPELSDPTIWPDSIDISCLRLNRVLHDSVSVVTMVRDCVSPTDDFIFKSSVSEFSFLYHELRFLLNCPPHPNIIRKPLYIITKKSAFGGKHGVYGFILPYYPLGSLRDILPARRLDGTLAFATQMKWMRQITSALLHIQETCGTFYSDLRPDNILLTPSASGSLDEDLVLIDFEQRGNWYEWCAPEVRPRMYKEHLSKPGRASLVKTPAAVRKLLDNCPSQASSQNAKVDSPIVAQSFRNLPWLALERAARESAMVFSLGLLMYCIFEGTCNPNSSMTNAWPIEPHVTFPEFRLTPEPVQSCIRWCTADAPEWSKESPMTGVRRFRRAGESIVSTRQRLDQTPSAVLREVVEGWEQEVSEASHFLDDQERSNNHSENGRPTLRELAGRLDSIAQQNSY